MRRTLTFVAALTLGVAGCSIELDLLTEDEPGSQDRFFSSLPGYVALGDSITFGVGASSPEKNHVNRFRSWLEDEHFHGPIDHVNLAVIGATSQQILDDQTADAVVFNVKHVFRDRVISVASGGNDLLSFIESPDFAPCASGDQAGCQQALGAVLAEYADNLDATMRRLRLLADSQHAALLATTQYLGFLQAACSVDGAIDARGNVFIPAQQIPALSRLGFLALEGAVIDPSQPDPFPGLNDIMRATAADYDAIVVDAFFPFYQALTGGQQLVLRDCIHPNDDGHALIFRQFVQAFTNHLAGA
jgi:lysophospholipase L1-like esterase